MAEAKKTAKYTGLGPHHIFAPVAFDTFGTWGKEADGVIAVIGKKIAENSGEQRSLEFLRQRISIVLQRGNAASVLGTLRDHNRFEKTR